jgi:hypothetical protein
MNKQQMTNELLSTSSHVILHSNLKPLMTQETYNYIVNKCDRWLWGHLQLMEAIQNAKKKDLAGSSNAED